jgi:nitrite reductase/ring-hydroxylating ferredoxin subunit
MMTVGWFPVGYSRELPAGGVEPIEHFGREMVLYRGEDGEAHVLDAHCRHLGAHLGYGGRVEGSAIRCPFHAWRWSAGGECDEIPYAPKIPAGATLRSWPVAEANELIFVWHGPPGTSPEDEIPRLDPDGLQAILATRRWIEAEATAEPKKPAVERRRFGPGFFVDRVRAVGEIVICGGWTPVDALRGHLRMVVFVPRDRKWDERIVRDLWRAYAIPEVS